MMRFRIKSLQPLLETRGFLFFYYFLEGRCEHLNSSERSRCARVLGEDSSGALKPSFRYLVIARSFIRRGFIAIAMAAPVFSTPFQPYVYQSPETTVTPFQILGGESQILQIMLKSQEKLTAKPGTMCYMSGSIQMDNNYFPENEGGFWQWLFGKSVASVVLFNFGPDDGFVGIAAPSPARILPIDLANFGGEILCQPDAFLCSVNDVTVASTVDQRAPNIEVGAEVILKQKLVGQGLAFLVGCGSVAQKILAPGEVLVADAACIVAMTNTINFQLKHSYPMRRVVFGGDNQLMATLTGPGVVFIQSLPFHRLSQRIARAVAAPGLRENPKFFIQIAVFFFLAYVVILSSLILTDV